MKNIRLELDEDEHRRYRYLHAILEDITHKQVYKEGLDSLTSTVKQGDHDDTTNRASDV